MQKRLYRSDSEKMLFGVCGGLADYFSVDPTVVRIAFVLGALLNGLGIILYIVMAIVVPREPRPGRETTPPTPAQPASETPPPTPPAAQPTPPEAGAETPPSGPNPGQQSSESGEGPRP